MKTLKFFGIGLLLSFAQTSHAKIFNVRYSFMDGPMFEFALGRLGLGVTYQSYSTTATSGTSTATVTGNRMGGRLSIYSSGIGSDSWYAGALGGVVTSNYSQTVSGTEFTAKPSASYYGFVAGYHWFWGVFNLNLGLGSLAIQFPTTQLTSSTGTAGATFNAFSFALPAIDLGIGLAF